MWTVCLDTEAEFDCVDESMHDDALAAMDVMIGRVISHYGYEIDPVRSTAETVYFTDAGTACGQVTIERATSLIG